MKLLLDENVSDRIIQRIADLFPGSTHIKSVGLKETDDGAVWDWAKRHEFTIVSDHLRAGPFDPLGPNGLLRG